MINNEEIEAYQMYERDLEEMQRKTGKISPKLNLLGLITGPAKDRMSPQLNDSSFLAFCGSRRSGKSMLAICLAHSICPDLSIENVAFSFQQLKDLIYSKERTAIIWDEAAVTSYSRDFMTKTNKDLNKFFQVFGYRKIAICATFQTLGMLDAELRSQLNAVFWSRSVDRRNSNGEPYTKKYVMPFKVTQSPFFPSQIKAWDFLPPNEPNYKNIGWIELPQLDDMLQTYGVPKKFISDYQKLKNEFFIELGKEDKEETPKIDKRMMQTIERQQKALKESVDFMQTKMNMTQQQISSALKVPRATLHSWELI